VSAAPWKPRLEISNVSPLGSFIGGSAGEKKGTGFPKQEVNAVIKIRLLKAAKHSLEAGGKLALGIHATKKSRSNKLVASAVANATILPAVLTCLPLARHAIAG
jgi:hypothetical protein